MQSQTHQAIGTKREYSEWYVLLNCALDPDDGTYVMCTQVGCMYHRGGGGPFDLKGVQIVNNAQPPGGIFRCPGSGENIY